MAAASVKESGSDHMWTVLFFFHGVVQRHLLTVSALSLIVFLFIFFSVG